MIVLAIGDGLAADPALIEWIASHETELPTSIRFDAVSVGSGDIARLAESERGIDTSLPAPFVSSNAIRADGDRPVAAKETVVECGDRRVAVLSVSPAGDHAGVVWTGPVDALANAPGVAGADLTVLMSSLGLVMETADLAVLDSVDVVIGAGQPGSDEPMALGPSGPVLLRAGYPGRCVGTALIECAGASVQVIEWQQRLFIPDA